MNSPQSKKNGESMQAKETLPWPPDESQTMKKATARIDEFQRAGQLAWDHEYGEGLRNGYALALEDLKANQESPPQAAPTKVEGWVIEAIENMLSAHWNLYSDHWKHIPTLTPDDDICRKDLKRALDWLKALTLTTEGESGKVAKSLPLPEPGEPVDDWIRRAHKRVQELEAELETRKRPKE